MLKANKDARSGKIFETKTLLILHLTFQHY